jgi:hypothetical protein
VSRDVHVRVHVVRGHLRRHGHECRELRRVWTSVRRACECRRRLRQRKLRLRVPLRVRAMRVVVRRDVERSGALRCLQPAMRQHRVLLERQVRLRMPRGNYALFGHLRRHQLERRELRSVRSDVPRARERQRRVSGRQLRHQLQ